MKRGTYTVYTNGSIEYYELMWAGNLDIAMQKLDWSQNMSHEFWLLQITKCDV